MCRPRRSRQVEQGPYRVGVAFEQCVQNPHQFVVVVKRNLQDDVCIATVDVFFASFIVLTLLVRQQETERTEQRHGECLVCAIYRGSL